MNVKELRLKLGLTQAQLAEICGVTLRTIQNWENKGTIPPSMLKLLSSLENGEIISSGDATENGTSIAAGSGSRVTINKDTERFYSTLEKQQEIMSRQLEEMAEMRKQAQKKDEQIDVLLGMLKDKMDEQ